MRAINYEEVFMRTYGKLMRKIDEYKFLLYQYSGEFNFKLVELLDLKKDSECNMGVRIKVNSKFNLYLNILIMMYSKMSIEHKKKYARYIENIIYELYKLKFQLNINSYERAICLIEFYAIDEEKWAAIKSIKAKDEIVLKDDKNNNYNIQVFDDGIKIFKNEMFLKGYYCALSEREIRNIDLVNKDNSKYKNKIAGDEI